MSELTQGDADQISALGKTLEDVESQVKALRSEPRTVQLVKPCTLGEGVVKLTGEEQRRYHQMFESCLPQRNAIKFVAASGNATRMFQCLVPLAHEDSLGMGQSANPEDQDPSLPYQSKDFFEKLNKFAFFEELQEVLESRGQTLDALLDRGQYGAIARFLLDPEGLNYSNRPKALIPFHRYKSGSRTALEEHLREAWSYTRGALGIPKVHFTISHEHVELVGDRLPNILRNLSQSDLRIEGEVSIQESATDSIALELDNRLARTRDGRLIFRAGGHGALISNLDRLKGDIIFIRTIDNILPEDYHQNVIKYKKILGGYLISLQKEVFRHIQKLSSGPVALSEIRATEAFARCRLFLRGPEDLESRSAESRQEYWVKQLNRPVRVCGVVPREAEPGGAPFWVKGAASGIETVQIVEPAEVNMDSPEQKRIWESARYFNTVDIVCGVRGFQGHPFNLLNFRDAGATFVTTKLWKGRLLRSLELPGLWNGSMARWNTVFVETPRSTFRPVKTALDLLKLSGAE